MDLVIRNARLPFATTPTDLLIGQGRILDIAPKIQCDAPQFDAEGKLLTSGLIETHIHLDKAGILSRCQLCEGTLAEAVRETANAKRGFTEEDVFTRAAQVIEQAISHGTNRLRTFVEVDPRAGFRSFAAILRLREAYAHAIDLQICAFAQDGLTNDPGTYAMLDQALREGADLIGGCPYTDPDPRAHISQIFDLAERHDVAVDFHLDFDLDPSGSNLPFVIAETIRRGWQNRVSIGHVTKLSAMPPDDVTTIGQQLAENGIALTVCPATDLYLLGRTYSHLIPRGVAPALRLHELGVVTTLATNNVLNPFTPFGDASLIRMANLFANIAHAGTEAALDTVFAMITTQAARLMSLTDPTLKIGSPADLVLFDASSPAEAIASIAPALCGWKVGRQTFHRPHLVLLSLGNITDL